MFQLFVAGSMLVMASTSVVEPLSGEAVNAAAVVDAFHAALQRGDTAGAAGLLSDDALIFEEGHVERGKAEYAKHHLPADAAFSKSVTGTVARRSGGAAGDFAWVASEGRSSGAFKAKAVDSMTTETMVLKRYGSSWKIVHIHWSSHSMKDD
jgi:ketosteroid isomerase-like protein